MKFSPNGLHVLHGVGNGRIYIDGVTPPGLELMLIGAPVEHLSFLRTMLGGVDDVPSGLENLHAGGWDWKTDDVVVGNGSKTGDDRDWQIWSYRLSDQTLSVVDPRGCTLIYASGSGEWVAFLADGRTGSFDSDGRQWVNRVALAMSPDGTRVLAPMDRSGLYLTRPDGTDAGFYQTGPVLNVQAGSGFTLYQDGRSQLHAIGRPDPATPLSGSAPCAARMADGTYQMVSWVPARKAVFVFPWVASGPIVGYPISADARDFNPDMIALDGKLVVATGANAGETIARIYDVDLGGRRFRRDAEPWQALTPVDLSAALESTLPTIAKFPFKCYVGFSWVPSGHAAPGNCQILTPMAGEPTQDWREMADLGRPVFAEGDTIALNRPKNLLGQIGTVEGGSDDYATSPAFSAYLASCRANKTRPTFADDANPGAYPIAALDRLPSYALPTAEFYPIRGESPDETIARLDAKMTDLLDRWRGDVGIVVPTYTQQGAWDKACVLAIAARTPEWSRRAKGRLKVVWIFPRERNGQGGPIEDLDMFELGNRIASAASAAGSPILRDVTETVATTSAALMLLMERTPMARVISDAQFNKQPDGRVTVTIGNPLDDDYDGIGKKGDVLPGDSGSSDPAQRNPTGPDCVLSAGPSVRKAGTAGSNEVVKPPTSGAGVLGYSEPNGRANLVPCLVRG